ncbi:hypothetical protein EV424DRAFT_1347679 [Suillus variegatus]|nr:hypothetical protein EV424DRAFT_1347679 [Suillus variegatus]
MPTSYLTVMTQKPSGLRPARGGQISSGFRTSGTLEAICVTGPEVAGVFEKLLWWEEMGIQGDGLGCVSHTVEKIMQVLDVIVPGGRAKMSTDEHRALEVLKDDQNAEDVWQDESEQMDFGDVLNGSELLPISHTGGKFADLVTSLLGDFWDMNQAFALQLLAMTNVYLTWTLEKFKADFSGFFDQLKSEDTHLPESKPTGQWTINVINVFYADKVTVKILSSDRTIASALIRQG